MGDVASSRAARSVTVIHSSSIAGLVDVFDDGRQTRPLAGFVGSPRLAADAEHRTDGVADRALVAADEDHGRRAVAGDVGARCVDDESQVLRGEELLDQLGAELALHERVGGDLPDPAGRLVAARGLARSKNRSMNGTVSA